MKIKTYVGKIDKEQILREESELIRLLPDWRKEKALALKNDGARAQSIAAGLLLTKAISEYGTEPQYFNITHSGDYVAVIVGDAPVGIDIEHKDDKRFKVTDRMFTESEMSYIHSADEEEGQCRFRDVWSMKEAFLKCIGIGIVVPLNTFTGTTISSANDIKSDGMIKIFMDDNLPEKLRDFSSTDYYYKTTRLEAGRYSLTTCSTAKM
ncbi:4'-phosphopantetheinyl transferase superfamily protein [Lachnospiraceae bacterium NE2001]|nr:4'-phosphopantetheinyl transferase superfamily protein [Lachnospiraceae bacterium NE2001]